MKGIKRKMIYSGIIPIVGIAFLIIGSNRGVDATLISFGTGLTVVGIAELIQCYGILKNEEKRKKYELAQNEERLLFIVNKSRSLMFVITLIFEFIAMVILMIADYGLIANIIGYIVGAQTILYMAIYYFFSRKY